MVNVVHLLGRLGQKPLLRQTKTGTSYCFLNLALSSKRKQQDGSYAEYTDWVSVKCYQKTAENCAKFLDKGRQVYVEGKVRAYEKQGEDGKKIYSLDVIADSVQFIGGRSESSTTSAPDQTTPTQQDVPFGDFNIPF